MNTDNLHRAYRLHVKTCVFKLRTIPLPRAVFASLFGINRWHRVTSENHRTFEVNLLSGETRIITTN